MGIIVEKAYEDLQDCRGDAFASGRTEHHPGPPPPEDYGGSYACPRYRVGTQVVGVGGVLVFKSAHIAVVEKTQFGRNSTRAVDMLYGLRQSHSIAPTIHHGEVGGLSSTLLPATSPSLSCSALVNAFGYLFGQEVGVVRLKHPFLRDLRVTVGVKGGAAPVGEFWGVESAQRAPPPGVFFSRDFGGNSLLIIK